MAEWPADRVERRPVSSLTPYARNARTHSAEQVDQIAASIREWGWTIPVLVDEDGTLIAGHCRVLAAHKLGIAEIPVMVASGWSDGKRRAYALADNKLALNAGWDNGLLRVEIAELQAINFELDLIGFGADELAALTSDKNAGLIDPDEAPETPAAPVSEPGDIWLLGKHRLVCGDCTDPLVVDKALNGVKPHLMVTDPPYGVEYDAKHRRALQSVNSRPAQGAVSNDDRADWREAWGLYPGDVAYVWHAGTKAVLVAESLLSCGFEVRTQIVWAKSKFVIGRGHYHVQHEPCWYVVKGTGHWQGDRTQSTLWSIDHRKSETGHSTQKPVECMKRPIENNSSPGQAVYDPFVGSGTTIIAAEMTGRACHAIELSPAYIDVALTRWQNFTGQTAALEPTGETFAELMARRCPKQPIKAKVNDAKRTKTKADAPKARHRHGTARPHAKKRAHAGSSASAGPA